MHAPTVTPYSISSGFRPPSRPNHEGIDIPKPVGTLAFAVLPGKVILAENSHGAPGITVMLSINDGEYHVRYNHLSKISVKLGQVIREGTVVGLTGNTGKSTGPHLHFAVYKKTSRGYVAINPVPWLAAGQASGGGSKPINPTGKDDEMLAIYEGPDSQAAKKWVDLRTGKALRSVTGDEMVAVRSQRALFPVLIVTLDAKEWKAFLNS